ncbi:MAG TPA: hypothetical protein VN892_15125 [Solirubrobacteraceae bacterium]|nr:hypothetical protein [Solirubrobacteraceae bacterium]
MSAVVDRFDVLLEWASELSAGSWSQWREACGGVGIEPTLAMQDLAALGHIEVDWTADRFSCPPPTAAFLHRSSGSVLLTGARPRGLLDRLSAVSSEAEDLDVFVHEPVFQQCGPKTVLIEVELDDVGDLCNALELEYVFDPALRIAERLAVATLGRVAHREDWPPRDEIPRRFFNPEQMRFNSVGTDDTCGLWWYEGYRREEAWIRDEAQWWQVPTREYAPYLAYPNATFLLYSPERRQLRVPARVPLPPLQARAATLASGRLPRRAASPLGDVRFYENISCELARRISRSLGTPLGRSA